MKTPLLKSYTKYLRLALVFMLNSALGVKFNLFIQKVFIVTIDKKKIFWREGWVLGYYSMRFRHFPDISFPEYHGRQLVYTMFISDNRASFHLW